MINVDSIDFAGTSKLQSVLDALTARIVVVDGDCNIIAANAAWKTFADANGFSHHEVGSNYLLMLKNSFFDKNTATNVNNRLIDVLAGDLTESRFEYPFQSNNDLLRSSVNIIPFPGQKNGAVIAHENITDLKIAELQIIESATLLSNAFSGAVRAIAMACEKRDPYTAEHQREVAELTDKIAILMGLSEERRRGLVLGALVHDIGKISIPAEILNRPGKLSAIEFELVKTHVQAGYEILENIPFPWPIADMVLQHHERVDGTGYPNKLKGDQICLESRIIAVADVYSAITAHRPYRPAKDGEVAISELLNCRGTKYDENVVDTLFSILGIVPIPLKGIRRVCG